MKCRRCGFRREVTTRNNIDEECPNYDYIHCPDDGKVHKGHLWIIERKTK